MSEILLIRHAESEENLGKFTAFGNEESPLTEKGKIVQSLGLRAELLGRGIDPAKYSKRILASTLRRTGETAICVGFKEDLIDRSSDINETDVRKDVLSGIDIIKRHKTEGWIPEETRVRAERFVEQFQAGELEYEIFFTHGLFIASVLTVFEGHNIAFDAKRGYIPLQASITPLTLNKA